MKASVSGESQPKYPWDDWYIDLTKMPFFTRLTEHRRATKNGGNKNNIAEHHLQTDYRIDWDSAERISFSTDYYNRLTLERWFTNLE